MILLPGLLLHLLSVSAAAPSPLDRLVAHLGRNECDEAFLLVSQVRAPAPPTVEGQSAGRTISAGAVRCRAQDSKVALALTALAAQLAPDDPQVLLAHAEGLLGEQERGEAEAVLDRLVKAQPAAKAPAAWFLRARLASEEGDLERAVELLAALSAEAAHRERASPLLAEARAALAVRKAEREELAEAARRPAAPAPTPTQPPATQAPSEEKPQPTSPRHRPGEVVATFKAWVGMGESRSFVASGLVPGQTYVFHASGSCRRVRMRRADVRRDVFGIDFRVQFGSSAESRALRLGQEGSRDESHVPFVADASEVVIRVFDSSSAGPEASCYLTDFSVTAK